MTDHATQLERFHLEHARIEVFTMALYDSIVLLAATVPVTGPLDKLELVGIIWGTTIGLTLAHVFAFRIATHIQRSGVRTRGDRIVALAQLGGAAGVAAISSVPILILPASIELNALRYTLAGVLAASGYLAGRAAGGSHARSLLNAAFVAIVGLGVAILKHLISH